MGSGASPYLYSCRSYIVFRAQSFNFMEAVLYPIPHSVSYFCTLPCALGITNDVP